MLKNGEFSRLHSRLVVGDLLVIGAMLIFGTYPLFLRFFPEVSTITFLFSFQVVGAITFLILSLKQGWRVAGGRLKILLLCLALVAVGNDLTYFMAFRTTSVANAAFAHQMVSIFLLFLAPYFIGERTKRTEWIALLVSLLGLCVLYGGGIQLGDTKDLWGITLGLVSALFYALLIVLYRYLPQQGLSISLINFWRYSFSTLLLLPLMAIGTGFESMSNNIWVLLSFGLLFAVIASGIHNFGISKSRSMHVSIIGKSEPVIAAVYAMSFLGEIPSASVCIGGALILGSSFWLTMRGGE